MWSNEVGDQRSTCSLDLSLSLSVVIACSFPSETDGFVCVCVCVGGGGGGGGARTYLELASHNRDLRLVFAKRETAVIAVERKDHEAG